MLVPWVPVVLSMLSSGGEINLGAFHLKLIHDHTENYLKLAEPFATVLGDLPSTQAIPITQELWEQHAPHAQAEEMYVASCETRLPEMPDKERGEAKRELARLLIRLGKYYVLAVPGGQKAHIRKATFLLEKACAYDPGSADAANAMGVAKIHLGILLVMRQPFEEARRYLQRAIQLDPNWAFPWFNMALTFDEEKKLPGTTPDERLRLRKEERTHYIRCREIREEFWSPTYNLAYVSAEIEGLEAEAERMLARAFEIDALLTLQHLERGDWDAPFAAARVRAGRTSPEVADAFDGLLRRRAPSLALAAAKADLSNRSA
jgi:tetratricopeptide (TPR) repeat protein